MFNFLFHPFSCLGLGSAVLKHKSLFSYLYIALLTSPNGGLSKWPFVSGDYVVGNEESAVAVITCGSYSLPKELIRRSNKLAIAGFCETENDGIAKILQNLVSNPHIRILVVCGEGVVGHEPGQTIISLYKNGIDESYRIVGSEGTIPILHPNYFRGTDPHKFVKRFQSQIVKIVDARGETDV